MRARSVVRHRQGLRRRLAWLLAGRIVLTVVVFAIALALERQGRAASTEAQDGLYATIGAAFLATAIFAQLVRRSRRLDLLAALQPATDAAIVTSLVYHSGGHESIFGFLYVPVAVYGAVLFDRRGALGAAAFGAAAYGSALVLTQVGLLRGHTAGSPPGHEVLALWGVHAGAVMLAAFLATVLGRELHRADEALDASASDLRSLRRLHERIVESLTSGLLTTDLEGRVTSFNPEAARITGVRGRDALGRDLDGLLPGARELLGAPLGRGQAGSRQRLTLCRGDGESLHLGLSASVLRDTDGRTSGWVVIFQDVTDVVRMELELRRSERLAAAGQLSSDLAHEIRNPLAAISGSVQMLKGGLRPGAKSEEQRRLIAIVLRETDRLNQLIADFLAYARPTTPKREAVAVRELIDEVLEMFEMSRLSQVQVRRDVEPDLRITADAAQLRQVVWNLVLNAAQAMPEGGTITIATARVKGGPAQEASSRGRNARVGEGRPRVELRISDTGIGMQPEVVDRIFDPFFTTKRGGTGLGLATVHRIVEGHGGSMRVDSSPGDGTCVSITFEAAEEGT